MTNKQLAEEILQKVGGKKNINSYSHCSTRLRFDLKDKNSIDKAALERTDGILQVMEVAGQTQVVIGSKLILISSYLTVSNVKRFYNIKPLSFASLSFLL